MVLMSRFLPFIAIILFLITILVLNYLPVKRFLAYKLGTSQDLTTSCCNAEVVATSQGIFDEDANLAIFNNQVIDYPKTSLAQAISFTPETQDILGTTNTTAGEKWIEVSLKEQRLRAWEGNKIVMEFPISSGLWSPTPTGTYYIWYKTRNQRMSGGSKELGTYYNLPNVPNNMFFYKGYAIHGAYWHNNFGQRMSHGCVNAPLAQVAQLFEWAGPVVPANQGYAKATPENPGTKVFIQ